ncbi:YcxB family protein [Ferruginibacter sp. HRS2-29]|uniref:YcxB family protein n=1 Tax=Ferruginibacter sp. HRS2-29 TaxID=2487334 RepID=UPI0020CC674A|nr:YcxB family protein [Ferruginibacter sp. HRS2-29]
MKDNFSIEEHFTYTEFIRVVYFQLFRIRIMRLVIVLVLIASVLGMVSALLNPASFKNNTVNVIVQFLMPLIFLFTFFTFFIFIGTGVMRIIKPGIFKPVVVQFNHWGMIRRGKITYELPWNKIRGYKETKRFIFLFNAENPNIIHTIQKRMFSDQYESRQFISFFSQKISSRNDHT